MVLHVPLASDDDLRALLGPQAQIGVTFNCCGATFNQPGGLALRMYGATVKGDVLPINGFRSEGELRPIGNRVGVQSAVEGTDVQRWPA